MESKGDEFPVADVKRMMIRMSNKLKEKMQRQLNEYQENMYKKLEKTQRQLNEFRQDINEHQNETKETIKKRYMKLKRQHKI
jgi:uncharacterized membrane-anchored protein YhcB (DUF1043 family)